MTGRGPGQQALAAIRKPRIDPQIVEQAGEPLSDQLGALAAALGDKDIERAWKAVSVLHEDYDDLKILT